MHKLIALVAAAVCVLAASASPAGAITGNYEKDFIHPYVGLVVFYDEQGEFSHRCSGTLISPSVFLTAGHCTDGELGSARIYFHQHAGANYDPETQLDPVTGYPEYCVADDPLCVTASTSEQLLNYGFDDFGGFPNIRDVGLVILDEPVTFITDFPALAVAGSLDRLATQRGRQDLTFTLSGYGITATRPNYTVSFRERLMATARLVNLRSALTGGFNLQTTANPGRGRGGACYGDSGGPVFYSSTDIIVGVTSFGITPFCTGVDFTYRIDQAAVLEWILSHVPEGESVELAEL